MQHQYNDGLCNGGRTPKLWIVYKGQIHTFEGVAIPGVAAITSTEFQKNGKWSNTTYHLELAEGAVPCCLLAPLHGQTWPENDRGPAYERFMQQFATTLSFEAFDTALSREYPRAHARMIEGEKALESVDGGAGEAELVEISTSKSCNRNPHTDVRVTAPDGRSWVIAYDAPKGTEIPDVCKLTDTKHSPGYKGGTTTLVFAIGKGVKVEIESYPKDGEAHSWALGRKGNGQPESTSDSIFKKLPEGEPTDAATSLKELMGKYGR